MTKSTQKKQSLASPHGKKSCWKKSLKFLFFILLLIGFTLYFVLSQSLFKAYPVNNKVQLLSIEKGQTYTAFIAQLEQEQKIKFPLLLKAYRYFFIHDTLKAGVYEVRQGMKVVDVLNMVSDANNAQMNRIQVIEGTTFKQLKANLLADTHVKKTILHLSNEELLAKINAAYTHPEGLFAPNTYFFAKGETDLNILKNLYQHQMKNLDIAWEKRAQGLPYKNKYEALIMASIVEKETAVEAERTQVAGVFVRRLKIGMRLQTDPTVIYGMGDRYDGNIRRKDLTTPTAYNTYTMNGLPPTPIAMPSQRSIEAALHPDHSDSLYFVATGNGGHKFSATLAQHNQAVREYLMVLKQQKQQQAQGQ